MALDLMKTAETIHALKLFLNTRRPPDYGNKNIMETNFINALVIN